MKSKGLVSVVIPCFQQAHLLGRALGSIANQTYEDIEIIVVDDGSEPPLNIKNEYNLNLTMIRQENSGLSSARNTGIKHASGEFLKFIDADDEITSECIELQVSACREKHCINVIGFIDAYENKPWESIIPAFGDPISTFLIGNPAPIHSYLFTKDLFDEHRFCITDRIKGGCEDYDLLFRIAIDGALFTTIHAHGAIYHRSMNSMSSHVDNMQRSRANVWAFNVTNMLKKSIFADKYQSAILASYAFMHEIVKDEYFNILLCVEDDIVHHCSLFWDGVDRGIARSVLNKLKRKKINSKLVCFLENKLSSSLDNILINNQSIIDYRLRLNGYDNFFDFDYLLKILSLAHEYHDDFSLYGAGVIGEKLLILLVSSGLIPKKIYDRNFNSIKEMHKIKIASPSDISIDKPSLIVIASLSFRLEIYERIKEINGDVIIV